MKRERPPTREEFEKLLAWFDSDPDKAASTFNHTHSRLIRVFGYVAVWTMRLLLMKLLIGLQ